MKKKPISNIKICRRIHRGGDWVYERKNARVFYRGWLKTRASWADTNLGFRIVRNKPKDTKR